MNELEAARVFLSVVDAGGERERERELMPEAANSASKLFAWL
jgi:hypothetical protein